MILTDMVAAVRADVTDPSAEKWTDDELERHIAHSLKEFSLAIPLDAVAAIATDSGKLAIDISGITSWNEIKAIEYPIGLMPVCYRRFSLWAGILNLVDEKPVPDGSNCNVYYTLPHALDVGSSTIPPQFEELVADGACGFAAIAWGQYAMNRVNDGGATTAAEMLAWGKEKLTAFRAELRRLGRKNRVRVNTLYVPYYEPVSKTADWGP